MNDEQEVTAVSDEEATDVPEETPERPEPFVYPKEFTTERGEVIDLPWPGCLIEVKVAKILAQILKLAPQLRGLFSALDTATLPGMDPSAAASVLLDDVGDVIAQAVEEVPEKVIEVMQILIGPDNVVEKLSIMGDGAKLIGYFAAKEMSRLGQAGFNIRQDVGIAVPTLADVAADAADRGMTGEAPDGR
jgi:hypothetical protein